MKLCELGRARCRPNDGASCCVRLRLGSPWFLRAGDCGLTDGNGKGWKRVVPLELEMFRPLMYPLLNTLKRRRDEAPTGTLVVKALEVNEAYPVDLRILQRIPS